MSAIWIVDFGSQYTQLITRKMRELNFSSVILPPEEAIEKLQNEKPQAIILSGGPQSVFEDETDYSPFFECSLPVLGICYGMQIMGQFFKGKVEKGVIGEYGSASVHSESGTRIEKFVPKSFKAWMSHADHLVELPKNFKQILTSENKLIAGIIHDELPLMGLQLHPEVHHTQGGVEILKYFVSEIANLKEDWNLTCMKESCQEELQKAKGKKVLCAFSGGVDSLVAAKLTQELIGDDVYCFFVDHGLLRPQDLGHIEVLKKYTGLNIEVIDVKDEFISKLTGVEDPEKKRKIIGNSFIDIFERKVKEYAQDHKVHFDYLLQGTLYPDVIESHSPHKKGGKSVTIKSHHNVGGLPERMNLKLLEPLKWLFKDEVRRLGMDLGLEKEWVYRHPFPGPGIGVRVLGKLSLPSIKKVQHSDQILYEELKSSGFYDSTWQAFTVLLPVKTVGVKGDGRAFEEVIALRMVNSTDGMTADVTELPWSFFHRVSSRICNEVSGVTRVVYDVTSKPPGTIEWE